MDKNYLSRIIQNYLTNRYPKETEERIQQWLADPEHAEMKELLLQEHWELLKVNPDIFIYESLERVKECIAAEPVLTEESLPEQPIATPPVEPVVTSVLEPDTKQTPIVFDKDQLKQNPVYEEEWRKPAVIPSSYPVKTEEIAPADKPSAIVFQGSEPVEPDILPEPVYPKEEEKPAVKEPESESEDSEEAVEPVDKKEKQVWIDPDDEPLRGMEMNLGKYVPFRVRLLRFLLVAVPVLLIIGGCWYYFSGRKEKSPQWVVQTVAYGDSKEFGLPDGTMVRLSPGSTLEYPSRFEAESLREVKLTGEAFFSVMKIDGMEDFTVITPTLSVVALGTEFNVSAYPEDELTTATLTNGSVKIVTSLTEPVVLDDNQQFVWNNQRREATVVNIDPEMVIILKTGQLLFEKTSLPDILKTLERRFDVNFSIAPGLLNKEDVYSVKFINDENINEILYVLQGVCNFYYERNDSTIILSAK